MKCILFCGLLAFLVACSTDEQTDLNRLNITLIPQHYSLTLFISA